VTGSDNQRKEERRRPDTSERPRDRRQTYAFTRYPVWTRGGE